MHGTVKETRKLLFQLAVEWGKRCEGVEVVVCPPFTVLALAREELKGSHISLGAQNCYAEATGAFTGEVSAEMLKDIGCEYVILGHSERRTIFGETDELVSRKVRAVLDAGLTPIVCIGESGDEREKGHTESVLSRQMKGSLALVSANQGTKLVIAYEPVWAIGTGKTATPERAQQAHAFIRSLLREKFTDVSDRIPVLYGGSVKPENAGEIISQPDIDGGLIGGASLDADSFIKIIEAAAVTRT